MEKGGERVAVKYHANRIYGFPDSKIKFAVLCESTQLYLRLRNAPEVSISHLVFGSSM